MYDFVTFDCYGTLVDWEGGITAAFTGAAAEDGLTFERDRILALHAEIEPEIQRGEYRSYREVLREVARRAARELDWELPDARLDFLPDSLGEWKPFPDTRSSLERLRAAGCRLGILSNVDDDLLAATLRRLGVEFDLLVTAQQLRSYKPATPHFRHARERIGDRTWLHAAQSYFHDVVPSRRLGVPVAWINRKAEPPGDLLPDLELPTLRALAERLT